MVPISFAAVLPFSACDHSLGGAGRGVISVSFLMWLIMFSREMYVHTTRGRANACMTLSRKHAKARL